MSDPINTTSLPRPETGLARAETRRLALLGLLLITPVPTISVLLMLFASAGWPGKAGALVCKLYLVLLPLVWTIKVDRQRPRVAKPPLRGMIAGAISGVVIFAVMLGAYQLLRDGIDLEPLRAKARETGFAGLWMYLGIFVYIITVNSLLEEYVWRWFVVRQLETALGDARWRAPAAVLGSAALFTVHHVFALAAWVDWRFNALACCGVFLGAAIWSGLFVRYRSIWPAYVSHVLADLAVFIIGYDLIFG